MCEAMLFWGVPHQDVGHLNRHFFSLIVSDLSFERAGAWVPVFPCGDYVFSRQ
jgi:hypothetical protein